MKDEEESQQMQVEQWHSILHEWNVTWNKAIHMTENKTIKTNEAEQITEWIAEKFVYKFEGFNPSIFIFGSPLLIERGELNDPPEL